MTDRRLEGTDWTRLILAALGVWTLAYVLLSLNGSSSEHALERSIRRLGTHAAGVALCLAMTPFLARAAAAPLPRRIAIAAGLSVAAWAAHVLTRVAIFHLVDPLWGPVDGAVLRSALRGDGWMFPLWSALCLAVFAELKTRPCGPEPREAPHLWCLEGRRRVRINMADVTLYSAEGDYVRLHAPAKQYLVRGRLKDIEDVLPADRFMRVHRSSIVRLDAVQAMERAGSVWRIQMRDGAAVKVSRPLGARVRRRVAGAL